MPPLMSNVGLAESMIESPTVFVLGAGAHCSYGLPSGEQLKQEAVAVVRESLRMGDYRSFLLMATLGAARVEEVQPNRCEAFAAAMAKAGQASIDAFLEANRHQLGFPAIGKGAIAQILLRYEQVDIPQSDDDWLNYLFRIMLDGVKSSKEFTEKNRVSFITFNYDRLLERWLLQRIKYSFGIEDTNALEVLQSIPIHHVYGTLGQFPTPTPVHPHAWILASKGIRTIFDTEHDQSVLDAAKAKLDSARVVCLLGFGFHRENIELLDLVRHARACKGVVAASRFNILDVEWVRVIRPFTDITIHRSSSNDKCLAALRNLPIF